MRFLRGHKTYISAGAILMLALAGLTGLDVAELSDQVERIATPALTLAAICAKWGKDRRSVELES